MSPCQAASRSQPKAHSSTLRDAAGLALVVAAAFGSRLPSLGFYNDDWSWLEIFSRAPSQSLVGVAAHFLEVNKGLWFRPAAPVLYSVVYNAFGLTPWPYHAVFLALDFAVAWNFFRLLEEEGAGRPTALLAGLLAALYPTHDATHHWLAAAGAPFGLAATLAALRAFRRWERGRSAAALAAALALLAAGTLTYESAALLALLLPALGWLDRRRAGASALEAARGALAGAAPMLGLLAALVAYQRVLVPHALHPERHPMSLSPLHALRVLSAGFECTLFNRLLHRVARSAAEAAGLFSAGDWLGWAAAAAAAGAWAASLARRPARWRPAGRAGPRRTELLPLAGAAFFLLGYAPYFLDTTYTPGIFSEIDRVNLVPSLGGAAILAWLLTRLAASGRPRAAGAAAALTAAAFLLCDWTSGAQWARAAGLQRSILDGVGRELPEGEATILLYGSPAAVGSATVFNSTYDFDSALRLRFRREGLRGKVAQDRLRFEPDAAVLSWFGETRLPYRDLYAYDHAGGRLERIPDQESGLRWLGTGPTVR